MQEGSEGMHPGERLCMYCNQWPSVAISGHQRRSEAQTDLTMHCNERRGGRDELHLLDHG